MKRRLRLWLLAFGLIGLVFFHLTAGLALGRWQKIRAAALLQVFYYVIFATYTKRPFLRSN